MTSVSNLKLSLHAAAAVGKWLREFLYVRVEVPRRDLRVARLHGLKEGIVDEDVLVLGLDHVVALGAEARHVAVDVDRPLVFDAFQHRVDDDERTRTTDSRASHDTTRHLPLSK